MVYSPGSLNVSCMLIVKLLYTLYQLQVISREVKPPSVQSINQSINQSPLNFVNFAKLIPAATSFSCTLYKDRKN